MELPAFRVHGVRYQTRDVNRAVAFYTQQLGFQLKHQQGFAFASVSCGRTRRQARRSWDRTEFVDPVDGVQAHGAMTPLRDYFDVVSLGRLVRRSRPELFLSANCLKTETSSSRR